MKKLAVLVSGVGSILEALISKKLTIALVLADRECRAVEIAKVAGIRTEIIPRTFGKTFNRHLYTLNVVRLLKDRGIDLVVMAGYMTVFAPVMFEEYANRITNIHPSLLPEFKGERAVADALESGAKVTGTTIHLATEKLDDGPIIAQEAVLVLDGDTVETLWERIKIVERRLYPEVVQKLLEE